MLRKDLTPKPVYDSLRKLIHDEWHTKAEGQTDGDGQFVFRGFRGQYDVTVTLGDKTAKARLDLHGDPKDAKSPACQVTLP